MSLSTRLVGGAALLAALATTAWVFVPAASDANTSSIERGRYMARVAACNDCHTPGYAEKGGDVPEKDWLIGSTVGWHGDWGTTYPPNLRLYMQRLTEDEWVTVAHNLRVRPPMPWFILHDMSEQDLRALYRYVRHLGPAGEAAPAYVPPEGTPQGPVIQFPLGAFATGGSK